VAHTYSKTSRSALRIVATVCYSGYVPVAPGTAASAVTAVAHYYLCGSVGLAGWGAILLVGFAVAVYAAGAMAQEWGKDPRRVVIDEAIGYLVTVALLPHGAWTAVLGFLAFRVFDVVKPPPIRRLEELPGGWGIVLDDVLAGVYGNLVIRAGILIAARLNGAA